MDNDGIFCLLIFCFGIWWYQPCILIRGASDLCTSSTEWNDCPDTTLKNANELFFGNNFVVGFTFGIFIFVLFKYFESYNSKDPPSVLFQSSGVK